MCGRCEQSGQHCIYPETTLHFLDASNWAAVKSRKARAASAKSSSDCGSPPINLGPACNAGGEFNAGRSFDTKDYGREGCAVFPSQVAISQKKFRAPSQEPDIEQEGSPIVWSMRNGPDSYDLGDGSQQSALIRQPQEVLPTADRLYLSHFANHTIGILPPNLRILCETTMGTAATNHAAMALGAANLAMLLGTLRPRRGFSPRLPDSTHIVSALRHVGTALSHSKKCDMRDVATIITVQLLLSFVQVEIGDLDGFIRYLRSIEGYLCIKGASLYSEELIYDTTNLRPLTFAFSNPLGLQDSHLRDLRASRPSLNWRLTDAEASVQFRFVGSDAVELNLRIMFFTAIQMNADNPSKALRAIITHYRRLGMHTFEDEELAGSAPRIAAECQRARRDLRKLTEHLRTLETPPVLSSLSTFDTCETTSATPVGQDTHDAGSPLRFQSHDQAMDAADYVFARALCEEAPFFIIPGSNPAEVPSTRWLRLLMRIAAGLDMNQCAQRNKYRRGILDMLFCSTFFFNNTYINSLLTDLIASLLAVGENWEDCNSSFEVTKAILQAVQHYQDRGFKLFMASVQSSTEDLQPTVDGQTKLVILYGQDAAGRPLDCFLKVKSASVSYLFNR